ncbi:amidase [Gemmatimonas groenlandica]|uniref:Amidase n=1 Tax=Gemmatimonas groenlandica TaxID=2732249 RepID=A0A6M4ILE5_9BACT|nr:amidase [Gemmatimonas groenlandica]QJR35824.1 amidase [Gemmatimonas groenlandica]
MSPTRREALAHFSALLALPLIGWPSRADDPLTGTIAQFQAGRLRGDYSAVEVTTDALRRCHAWNGGLRAIDQLAASALGEARASDARARRRALIGALDGVPLFAKSIYDMKGMPTTASSAEWARLFPAPVTRDALEVQRLRAAGAVLLGKTAADDFAYRGNGTSSLTGQVRNPHDRDGLKTPGGSSAGSAVVVACGMAFAALGTDDGGSNRIPAQFTGVVGMKPSFGLVPRSGVLPTWPYLDTHGPLARNVADAALMLDAIAGPDASDGIADRTLYASGLLGTLRDDALRGARLGLVELHVPRTQMSAECIAVFDRAIADCTAAGAVVDVFAPPVHRVNVRELFAADASRNARVIPNHNAPAPTANALLRYFARQGNGAPDAARNAERSVQRGLAAFRAFYDVLPTDWESMRPLMVQPYEEDAASQSFARSRASAVAQLASAFEAHRIEAMVYPTMPFSAPAASAPWPDVRTALGYGNWLGLPEVSVPAGYGMNGMPAGNLSFVGLPGSDARLLALAHAYEQRSRRFVAPPTPPATSLPSAP